MVLGVTFAGTTDFWEMLKVLRVYSFKISVLIVSSFYFLISSPIGYFYDGIETCTREIYFCDLVVAAEMPKSFKFETTVARGMVLL